MRRLAVVALCCAGCATGSGLDGGARGDGAMPPPDASSPSDASPDLVAMPDSSAETDAALLDARFSLGPRDVPATPIGSARVPDLAFDAAHDAYVLVYTWVPAGGNFRTEARVVTVAPDGTPTASAPVTVDPLVSPAHNSADGSVAVPDPTSSAPALVVFTDDRLSGGSGQLEIYGQFLRIAASGATLEGSAFRISNVDVTNESLPAVAWTGTGYYVAWADDRERGVRADDARVVFGRTVAVDGTLGAETRLGDDVEFQTYPQVSRCGDRLLAAWTDYLAPGGPLVIQYRGRLLDAATGAPVSGIFPIAADAMVSPDPPAVACDARAGRWRVAWTGAGPPSIKQLHFASVAHDGTVTPETPTTMQSDGALLPRLAWSPVTGALLLSFHAQDSYLGYVVELDASGHEAGPVFPLTDGPPALGTFWTAVATHATRAEALVVDTLDYDRVSMTVLRAP